MGAILTALRQGTPEWLDARHGLVTGSNVAAMMTPGKGKGVDFGETAMAEARIIASERYIARREEGVVTADMQRGIDLEPEALDLYEETMLVEVTRGAFFVHDTYNMGCSTDGLVADKEGPGLVEVKCLNAANHAAVWLTGSFPKKYLWQMQFYMWALGRNYCDFVAYHPDAPPSTRLFIARVYPDMALHTDLSLKAHKFEAIVAENTERLGVSDWKPFHVVNHHLAFPNGFERKNGLLLPIAA